MACEQCGDTGAVHVYYDAFDCKTRLCDRCLSKHMPKKESEDMWYKIPNQDDKWIGKNHPLYNKLKEYYKSKKS